MNNVTKIVKQDFAPTTTKKSSIRKSLTIRTLKAAYENELLNISPAEYQRLFQANSEWQKNLVASVFNKLILIPELAIRTGSGVSDHSNYIAELMDGLQRLGSIIAFTKNEVNLPQSDFLKKFKVDEDSEPVDLRGLSHSEMLTQYPEVGDYFYNFSFQCQIYQNISSTEAGTIFVDILNNSNDLNPQQKRQAIFSYVSRLVQRLSRGVLGKQHKLFKYKNDSLECVHLKGKNKTLDLDKTIAELIYMLDVPQGTWSKTGTTANTITGFYKDCSNEYLDSFPREKRLIKTLDLVYEGITQTSRANKDLSFKEFRNYAYLLSEQLRMKNNPNPVKFLNLYLDSIHELSDKKYITDDDLGATPYQLRMRGNPGVDTSVAIEMVSKKMNELSKGDEVSELDPVRYFTEKQRKELYDRQGGICALSGEHMGEFGSHVEADHVVDWILGGRTNLDNGQAVLRAYNRRKNQYT